MQENIQGAIQTAQDRLPEVKERVSEHAPQITRAVFFNFFSPHNETLDEKTPDVIDRKKYDQVVSVILNTEREPHHPENTTFFDNLRYGDFRQKDTLILRIYDKISQNCHNMTEEEKKKYIEIFIYNIV